jgi:hypothetical protein
LDLVTDVVDHEVHPVLELLVSVELGLVHSPDRVQVLLPLYLVILINPGREVDAQVLVVMHLMGQLLVFALAHLLESQDEPGFEVAGSGLKDPLLSLLGLECLEELRLDRLLPEAAQNQAQDFALLLLLDDSVLVLENFAEYGIIPEYLHNFNLRPLLPHCPEHLDPEVPLLQSSQSPA